VDVLDAIVPLPPFDLPRGRRNKHTEPVKPEHRLASEPRPRPRAPEERRNLLTEDTPMDPEAPREEPGPVEAVVKKASRFSREFLATVVALVSTAFGVVAALAWNSAIQELFTALDISTANKVTALFIYAVIVTVIGVVVIVYLGRLATRIGAEPVEFKFPVPKKSE